ncbi:O-Glycosyl hydrolase family 17 protein [Abeliophyllum distichum]|uniref:O-Glycosyl hydrolase family 17 protein n=1 Tax=Abeliophyllum distichum TaxID=126358 RepID=A0ABD1SG03_9LAMI
MMRSSPFILVRGVALMIVMTCYVFLLSNNIVEGFVGINWGRMTSNRLIPSMVVDLLLQNEIHEVKMFSASKNVLEAFSRSGIGVTITIPNESLKNLLDPQAVKNWINERIIPFEREKVNIRYVSVGADPYSKSYNNLTYFHASDVLKVVQTGLNEAGYGQKIKATIPHFFDVLNTNISKPSEADFRPDIKNMMVDIIRFTKENNAPFVMDLFPIYYVHLRHWDPEFAFLDNKLNFSIVDNNGLKYTNAFDFIHDSFLWAIKKAGVSDMKLVAGQVGWPTDGFPNASPENAERFYKGLLSSVTSNRGTPLLPGAPVDVYLHSLTDENKLKIDRGAFQRHWGIYRFDGVPKFKIDFTGQGRDIFPTTARGVTRMPERWCIYNGDTSNMTIVKNAFDMACRESDCTPLAPGGSCSNLDFEHNISYAFNMYFQMKFQHVENKTCKFQGLGKVVPDNPSIGTCVFPVEILQAEEAVAGLSFGDALFHSSGQRIHRACRLAMFLHFLLVFFPFI